MGCSPLIITQAPTNQNHYNTIYSQIAQEKSPKNINLTRIDVVNKNLIKHRKIQS